ncbi:MAG: hypothetical protein M1575_03680 [Patescibacteria group bacterium]|nr:hypothetical protein [Patescibacteria group bacterium]MCL5095792.1 hypothetical protein [Patescibacteria group bacterium]
MDFKANFAEIVGTPQTGEIDSWVYADNKLFLVLEMAASSGFPVTTKGKETFEKIITDFQSLPYKNLANLEVLVKKIEVDEGLSLSLVLAVQVGQVLYLVSRGAGRVMIKRGEKLGLLLSEDGTASGLLTDNDLFLLTSPRFSEVVSFDEVKQVFETSIPENNLSLTDFSEGLTCLIHRSEDTSGVAGLLLQFAKVKESWTEEKTLPAEEETFLAPKPDLATKEKSKLKILLRKLSSIIYNLFSRFRRSSQIYLRQAPTEEEKKKRVIFGIAVILTILLIISIVLGLNKKLGSKNESRFSQIYQSALAQLNEGQALVGLKNPRAGELLKEALNSLEALSKDYSPNSNEAKKIKELLTKINENLETASQVYKVNGEVFLDVGLIKEGGEGSQIAVAGENLYVADGKNSSLYKINLKSKASQILAGGEDFKGLKSLTVTASAVFALTDKGVYQIKINDGTAKLAIKADPEWGEIIFLTSFADNLYLLDKTKNQIWKYVGSESGFSGKKGYLLDKVDLALASSLAIDGSVWLTTDKILKFTYGKNDRFEIQNLNLPLANNLFLFTSEETKNLYLLDKLNRRILVLEKNGSYQSQYLWEGMSQTSGFVVSEGEKKILSLRASKIYQIGLK